MKAEPLPPPRPPPSSDPGTDVRHGPLPERGQDSRELLVETVARHGYRCARGVWGPRPGMLPWDETPPSVRELYRTDARRALAEMEAAL